MAENKNTNFQVGDTVLYEGWQGKSITKVTKITPKGGIRIYGHEDLLFKPDGTYRQSGEWGRTVCAKIKKLTPEEESALRLEFKRNRTVQECKKALAAFTSGERNLSYEASVKILDILKSEGLLEKEGKTV